MSLSSFVFAFRGARRALFVAVVVTAFSASIAVSRAATVETETLAPADAVSIAIGPEGKLVSAVVRQGSRLAVAINGEVGPTFDRLLAATGKPMLGRSQFPEFGSRNDQGDHPTIFDPTGERYAYIGLQGEDYVVIVDGKEIYRAPFYFGAIDSVPNGETMAFSPLGRHHWFVARTDRKTSTLHLIMDGKPGELPVKRSGVWPVFSADDRHYAYTTSPDPDRYDDARLVIDGRAASYEGSYPEVMPNGKLVTLAGSMMERTIQVDGKKLVTAPNAQVLAISSNNRIAVAVRGENNQRAVWVDGKVVPGTDGFDSLKFSPDGKRLAISGGLGTTGGRWVWFDGKRSPSYPSLDALEQVKGRPVYVGFTPDSSKAYAIAFSSGLRFLLVNGTESEGYKNIDLVVAPRGDGLAFIATGMNRESMAVINDQRFSSPDWKVGNALSIPSVLPGSLSFSADGKRTQFFIGSRTPSLVIDGELVDLGEQRPTPWISSNFGSGSLFAVFSPDGRHVAYRGGTPNKRDDQWIYVDGVPVHRMANPSPVSVGFSPDGDVLYWSALERPLDRKGMDTVVYANGELLLRLNYQTPLGTLLAKTPKSWRISPEGDLHLLAADDTGIVRHTIRPDDIVSVEAWKKAQPAAMAAN